MDLRVQRTKRNIAEAFIELRKEKSLEKITVTELAQKACINKATFYLHYQDIYDLSEQLENEALDKLLNDMSYPNNFVENPKQAYNELTEAVTKPDTLVSILFSGNRKTVLEEKLEIVLKERTYQANPHFRDDLLVDLVLSVLIHGGFHTFLAYTEKGEEEKQKQIVDILGNINEHLLNYYLYGKKD